MNRMPPPTPPSAAATRPLRILYAAGPGDVAATYRHWKERVEDPSEIVPTYSGQFFDLCAADGHHALVVASHPRRESLDDGPIRIEHRPKPPGVGGWRYHLVQLRWAMRLSWDAIRFRANVAIISSGACHYFGLTLLPLFGVRVVPCIHNALYPAHRRLSRAQRLELWLTGRFFRHVAAALMSCSRAVTRQVDEITASRHGPIVEYLPIYKRAYFADGREPPERPPFHVLFVGRVEQDKGVFDLLEIARRFADARRTDIEFDLCGTGSALDELRAQADAAGLASRFRTHGHCARIKLQQMYAAAHVVIVPTTQSFVEGFNQVVTEAVLAGRPAVSSVVCPAVEYLDGAVVLVPPEDVDAYSKALLRLCDDPAHYAATRANGPAVSEQFYDPANGWRAAVERIL
jgi:glycogen(starch) synthase